jgi:hypothetical protein
MQFSTRRGREGLIPANEVASRPVRAEGSVLRAKTHGGGVQKRSHGRSPVASEQLGWRARTRGEDPEGS